MEECGKNQNIKKEIGGCSYLNKNCWLVKNLNYLPYKRCQYCEFKFRHCLFLQYQIISLVLLVVSFSLFIFCEKKLSALVVIVISTLIIVYGLSNYQFGFVGCIFFPVYLLREKTVGVGGNCDIHFDYSLWIFFQ